MEFLTYAQLHELMMDTPVTVTFTTAAGDERVMAATLQSVVNYKPIVEGDEEFTPFYDVNENLFKVFEILPRSQCAPGEEGQWRSFKLDTVKSIEFSVFDSWTGSERNIQMDRENNG